MDFSWTFYTDNRNLGHLPGISPGKTSGITTFLVKGALGDVVPSPPYSPDPDHEEKLG